MNAANPSSTPIAQALNAASEGMDLCLTRLPFGWNGDCRPLRHPLDYIGQEAGGGIGAGPGIAVGAALALKDSGTQAAKRQ